MSSNNFQVKYNVKSRVFKNLASSKNDESVKSQNMDMSESEIGTIYAPDFSKYPRWPYEPYGDFQEPMEEMPLRQPVPIPPTDSMPSVRPTPPVNFMPSVRPAPPANSMPSARPVPPVNSMPSARPAPPVNSMPEPYPFLYRNPYVPVGRERISSGYSRTTQNRDMRLLNLLYTDINKAIYPIVDGSPIYEEEIDRETMAQLVDRVLRKAGEVSDEVQETILDSQNEISLEYAFEWNKENLLNAVVESILLNEIFGVRRPYYRMTRDRYRYMGGVYNGINYYY